MSLFHRYKKALSNIIEIEVEGSDMLKVILSCGMGGSKIIKNNNLV